MADRAKVDIQFACLPAVLVAVAMAVVEVGFVAGGVAVDGLVLLEMVAAMAMVEVGIVPVGIVVVLHIDPRDSLNMLFFNALECAHAPQSICLNDLEK